MNEKEFFHELGKCIYQIDGIYEEYGRNFHITSPNILWILYSLNDNQSHSQKEICEAWSIPRSTANTIIKELERQQLIFLQKIKGKRRELNISLTKKGKEIADTLLKDLYSREKKAYLTIQEPEKILNILRDLKEKLKIISKGEEQ